MNPTLLKISLESSFSVSPVECPPGYILAINPNDDATYLCQCDLTNPDIVNCNGTTVIIRVSGKQHNDP